MSPDFGVAVLAAIMLFIAVMSAREGVRMWRFKRQWDEHDRQQRCFDNETCTECGDCYLDHIENHPLYNHPFTNVKR